jgi:thymidylate kinase
MNRKNCYIIDGKKSKEEVFEEIIKIWSGLWSK